MQVGDQRFDGDDIQRLYESNDYPLQRRPSAHGWKFLDGEPDRLRCGRKAAIAQLSWPALALAHEQLSGYAVVECHSLAVLRSC